MAKDRRKKKKKSPKIPRKILIAQQKNDYMRRYVRVAKAIGALDVFKSLPPEELDDLWFSRVPALRVEPVTEGKINPRLMKIFRKYVSDTIKQTMVSIVKDGPKVTMEDYFTAGVTLGSFTRTLESSSTKIKDVEEIKQAFAPVARHNRYDEPYQTLRLIGGFLASHFSRPNSKTYSFTWNICKTQVLPADCLYVDVSSAEKITLKVDGKPRTCFRLCWPGMLGQKVPGSVKAGELGIGPPMSELSLDLYIQSHALQRMRERIDIGDSHLLYHLFYKSLQLKKVISIEPGVGLLEYRWDDLLLGYFIVKAINGIALIKTFLFVTNTGTPQGNKLDAVLGAEKLDKKYLWLDCLSTYIKTDITKSRGLCDALCKAGLQSLLELGQAPIKDRKTGYGSFADRYLGFAQRRKSNDLVSEISGDTTAVSTEEFHSEKVLSTAAERV
ncbi:MAG: hypothetical protein ACLFSB_01605 [Chitinispirillaceae bacterium]